MIPCEGFEIAERCFAPVLFDTSPLQVHTHANILHAYVDIGNERTYEDAHTGANKLFACAGMKFVRSMAEIEAEGRP